MTIEELTIRILNLETKLKKANFRIYLLESGKELKKETQKFYKETEGEQPDLLEAIGN